MKSGDVCSFTFYFILNMFTYLSLFSLNQNFFVNFSISFHTGFITLAVTSYILLITIKNYPGLINKQNKPEQTKSVNEAQTDESIQKIKIDDVDLYKMFNKTCSICEVDIVK